MRNTTPYPARREDSIVWSTCTIMDEDGTTCGEPLPPEPPMSVCGRHLRIAYDYCQTMIERATVEQVRAAGIKDSDNPVIRDKIREAQSVVYYAMVDGLVKIGTTIYLDVRMKTLGANLMATEPGDAQLERQRHAQFADLLARGREYFRPGKALLAHVVALQ
jgi:hypothetical protein